MTVSSQSTALQYCHNIQSTGSV